MRVFVVFLTVLVCFPLPSYGKDIGDLFGKLLGGVLNEATRQQQKQQQRQQIKQLKIDLNTCYNDQDVESCDRALAFPALNQTIRQQIQRARNKAVAYQERENSGTDEQSRTFVSPLSSNNSGQTSILRQDLDEINRELIREKSRTAQLNRQLNTEIDRVEALQKRVMELKNSIVVQSDRAHEISVSLSDLKRQNEGERLYFMAALGAFGLLTLTLGLKLWQNERSISLSQYANEHEISNSAHINTPHNDPPMGPPEAGPPIEITGDMPTDIRKILYG